MLRTKKPIFICLLNLTLASITFAQQPSGPELISMLQKGGYVLFIRHPKTNPDQADTDPLHLDNVKAQRQLSDDGRKQAKALGDAFRALKIPTEKVLSSKFFRAQEAAKLLNIGEVSTSLDVTEGGLVVSPNENKRRAAALQVLLSTPPTEGENLVIVSHRPNLQDAAGKELADVIEGEVVVFKPLGNGKSTVVVRVAPELWSEWAKR
jgi:phosphohistidine phosphatase SixA